MKTYEVKWICRNCHSEPWIRHPFGEALPRDPLCPNCGCHVSGREQTKEEKERAAAERQKEANRWPWPWRVEK